jgi:DNA invertase Pin-like site-specific DNA recombinase
MLPDTAASKVTATHLSRRALLYIRQSSLKQVIHNTESAIRQYDLRGKAIALGWDASQVTVIDIDQGRSGASAAGREGFQQMVAEVSLGRAGIVLGLECSRLARNNALFRYRNKLFCSAYGFMPRRDEEFLPRR